MSVISPVADDLAVVFLPFLPAGLFELLRSLGIRLIEVPEEEYPTLGCNVLAVAPRVVIVAEGNPLTRRALEASGCGFTPWSWARSEARDREASLVSPAPSGVETRESNASGRFPIDQSLSLAHDRD
jgi:N-dimethylarginine dimethylaminohydrolase